MAAQCCCQSQCPSLSGKVRLEQVNTGAGAERKHVSAACNQSRTRLSPKSSLTYGCSCSSDCAKLQPHLAAVWHAKEWPSLDKSSVAQQDSCHSQEPLSSAKQQASSKSACSTCRSLLPRQIARSKRLAKSWCVRISIVTALKNSWLLYPVDGRIVKLSC